MDDGGRRRRGLLATLLLTFAVGLAVGVLFTLLRLPVPAPTELASVVGIAGVFAGLVAVRAWRGSGVAGSAGATV